MAGCGALKDLEVTPPEVPLSLIQVELWYSPHCLSRQFHHLPPGVSSSASVTPPNSTFCCCCNSWCRARFSLVHLRLRLALAFPFAPIAILALTISRLLR